MTTDINMNQLKADALEIFCNGFACSESVIFSLRKHFQVDISDVRLQAILRSRDVLI